MNGHLYLSVVKREFLKLVPSLRHSRMFFLFLGEKY